MGKLKSWKIKQQKLLKISVLVWESTVFHRYQAVEYFRYFWLRSSPRKIYFRFKSTSKPRLTCTCFKFDGKTSDLTEVLASVCLVSLKSFVKLMESKPALLKNQSSTEFNVSKQNIFLCRLSPNNKKFFSSFFLSPHWRFHKALANWMKQKLCSNIVKLIKCTFSRFRASKANGTCRWCRKNGKTRLSQLKCLNLIKNLVKKLVVWNFHISFDASK